MVVDLSLTYGGAKARIGNLIRIQTIGEDDYQTSPADFYRAVQECADESRFGFEHDDNGLWNLKWTFDRDSNFVKAFERYCELKRLRNRELTVPRYRDAHDGFNTERVRTMIYKAFDHYAEQAGKPLMFMADDFMLEAIPSNEALFNAIEHGSDFCTKGEVTFSFHGGGHGVVTSANDPGQGCVIQPTSEDMRRARELHLNRNAWGLVETENGLRIPRGFGKVGFHKTRATVGSEKKAEGGFMVFAVYHIPAEEVA